MSQRIPVPAVKSLCVCFAILFAAAPLWAQAAKPSTSKTTAATGYAMRSECSQQGEFCVSVPASWKRLGDVFGGNGFVAAEPRDGVEESKLNQLTAATVDLPEAQPGQQSPDLDTLLSNALNATAQKSNISTSERSRRIVAGHAAETARVRLADANAVELLAFIQGDEDTVYTLALHCAASDEARMLPIFERMLKGWRTTPQTPSPSPRKH